MRTALHIRKNVKFESFMLIDIKLFKILLPNMHLEYLVFVYLSTFID